VSGRIVYAVNCSLDGYIEDADGDFAWSEPDEELHQFFNDLLRPMGTYLYGRRLYETMAVWETDPSLAADNEVMADFAAVWREADKIVYSTTLEAPLTERTRIERSFDPDEVRRIKTAATADLAIGNAVLASAALRAGVVDEVHLVVHPVVVGGGKRALPDDLRAALELIEVRPFPGTGVVSLRYRVAADGPDDD
jgi:dihydrofolate reductase